MVGSWKPFLLGPGTDTQGRTVKLQVGIYFWLGVPCLWKGSVYDVWCDNIHIYIYIYDIIWSSKKTPTDPWNIPVWPSTTCLWFGNLFIFVVWGSWDLFHGSIAPSEKNMMSSEAVKLEVSRLVSLQWCFTSGKGALQKVGSSSGSVYTPKIQHGTWKWWFPIGISFSKGPFSGSMFVLGGVYFLSWNRVFFIRANLPRDQTTEVPGKMTEKMVVTSCRGIQVEIFFRCTDKSTCFACPSCKKRHLKRHIKRQTNKYIWGFPKMMVPNNHWFSY